MVSGRLFKSALVVVTTVGLLTGCGGQQSARAGQQGNDSGRPATTGDPTLVTKQSFTEGTSAQSEYAKTKAEGSFYIALKSTNLRPDIKPDDCIDDGFFSLIRKVFNKDAKAITIVANVQGPGDAKPANIPLFEVSKDEAASPPSCVTDIKDITITPYYVATRIPPIKVDASILTKSTPTTSIAQTIVSVASDAIGFTGGSAWLTKTVNAAATATAAGKVDAAIQANWTKSDQKDYQFEIGPWPNNDDWAHRADQTTFSTGGLISSWTGISVDNSAPVPAVKIAPIYLQSVFGGGEGKYQSYDQILNKQLATSQSGTLQSILLNGISGFTTNNAVSIKDVDAMQQFCRQMRNLFANFLTADDALAARFAVLKSDTSYFEVQALQGADMCIDRSAGEDSRLPKLNSTFVVPDTGRVMMDTRKEFVDHRISAIAKVLNYDPNSVDQANLKTALQSLLSDPSKFSLKVAGDSVPVFPPNGDGKPLGGTGDIAVAQLLAAGAFRIGRGSQIPNQSISNIVGVALNKKTGKSSAILVNFANGDPAVGDDSKAEVVKVNSISFMPVDFVASLTSLDKPADNQRPWPDPDSCQIL